MSFRFKNKQTNKSLKKFINYIFEGSFHNLFKTLLIFMLFGSLSQILISIA